MFMKMTRHITSITLQLAHSNLYMMDTIESISISSLFEKKEPNF